MMPPPDGDEQLAQQHTDDGAHGNGQNGGQRLPVRGQGDGGEYDGQGDERHGDVGQAFEKAVASRYPEGPLRIREPLPQGQKRRKHRQIAQQQHHQVQGEEAPEQGGIRAHRLDGSSQQTHRRGYDPADQRRAHGHLVVLPPPGEHGGHISPLRGIGGGGIDAHGPGDHVAEQRYQKQQGHNTHQHAAGGAGHQGYGIDEAGVHTDVPGRHGGPDAEGRKQVNGRNDDAADNDGLGDLPPGVRHAAGIGAYHLKAQKVEDDDGDIRQTVQVEGRQEGPGRHVVDKAIFRHIHDAQHPHRHRQQNLDGGTEVQDKVGEEKPTYSYIVDNYYGYNYNKETGKWDVVNSGTENALYQIPVMKVTGLDYGEYNAVVTVFYDGLFNQTGDSQYSFWLDAVRIYDPMGVDRTEYKDDHEGYPQYIKLRDTLAKSTIGTTLFIDGKDSATIAEYANYGPNNEVYLMNGQAITFKIPQNANVDSIQIGAKAPDGKSAQMAVNEDAPVELSTATEMYYKINVNVSTADQTVVIANKGGTGILSLTNLKITFKNKPTDKITLTALNNQEQENAVSLVRALFTAPVATFSPETFEADWGRAVRAGKKATLTVKTSADVESITVDGQPITHYTTRTQRTGWGWWSPKVTYHVFTYTITAPAQTTDYAVCAVNAEGTASEAVTATLTVKPTTWWNWWF